MTFFYDLNKRLSELANAQQLNEGAVAERATGGYSAKDARAGKDIGKPGKAFAQIAKSAGEKYGSKERGEKVAGAVLAKLRGKNESAGDMDESAFQAAIGKKKYGDEGMKALQKAGREHASDKTMDNIRDKYNKYDEGMEEGVYQPTPNKSQIPAVQRKNDPLTLRDLEKERTQSPTTPEGMRALQDKLRKLGHLEEMSPEQEKSFAALAPPKDKITFADKIAGAKKEVDEMLGDVAASAIKKAVSGKNDMEEGNDFTGARLAAIRAGKPTFKVGGKVYKVSGDTSDERAMDESWEDMIKYVKDRAGHHKVGDVTHGSKHDIKHTATGRIVTRRADPNTGYSIGSDDDGPADGEKRGRGRPKGAKKALGAKGPSGKSKLMKREGADDIQDQGEYDQEGDMALDDINTIESAANELQSIIDANENLPEWVQSKINKAMDYLDTARDYMAAQQDDEQVVDEKAPPGAKAERMVKGIKKSLSKDGKLSDKDKAIAYATTWKAHNKGKVEEESEDEKDTKAEKAGRRVTKDIEYDEKKKDGIHGKKRGAEDDKAEKAGKKVAKDIEYDEKKSKKKEDVEENTVSGSVATAPGSASKSKSGMQFGKGVYEAKLAESFNSKLSTVLNEGMSISINADESGNRNLTVNATDDDATKLAEILKLAGMNSSHGYEEACPGCGQSTCGCDGSMMEEDYSNSPDEETTSSNYMVNTLSGGLNGPKTTGQTTIPVIASQLNRQMSVAEATKDVTEAAEQRLWNLYARYDTK